MPYFVRVLAEKPDCVPVEELQECLKKEGLAHSIEVEQGSSDSWDSLVLKHPNGDAFCVVERNPVVPDSLGAAELGEFIEEARQCKPESAARWLANYLRNVKAIYAFQVLNAIYENKGWDAMWAVQGAIWEKLGGDLPSGWRGLLQSRWSSHPLAVFGIGKR